MIMIVNAAMEKKKADVQAFNSTSDLILFLMVLAHAWQQQKS